MSAYYYNVLVIYGRMCYDPICQKQMTNSGESQEMSAEGVTQSAAAEAKPRGSCLSLRQKDRANKQMFYSLEG